MIYVDTIFVKELADTHGHALGALFGHKWCHFWSDWHEEEKLHALAERMGVPRAGFVELELGSHYLLTPVKREQALRLGAREAIYIGWLRACRAEADKQTPSLFPELP